MLHVETFTSRESFEGLRDTWERLLAASGQASPFLSHDWFHCCVEAYGSERTLSILVAREGEEPIGIAPLWELRAEAGSAGASILSFIAVPDTALVDFITLESHSQAALRAFVDHFYAARPVRWSRVELRQWPSHSRHFAPLLEILSKGRKPFFSRVASQSPYLPIRGDWESYLRSRPVQFRKAYRRIINRFADLPNAKIEIVRLDEDGSVLDELVEVSRRSWKEPKGIALSSRADHRLFFRELTQRAGRRGWLLAWLLRVDGRPVAMEYDLLHEGTVHALRADFDESLRQMSPGTYLEYSIIKHAFEHGYRQYCSGPGLKVYKRRWTDEVHTNMTVSLCRPSLTGWIEWFWMGVALPFLRLVRSRLSPASDSD